MHYAYAYLDDHHNGCMYASTYVPILCIPVWMFE